MGCYGMLWDGYLHPSYQDHSWVRSAKISHHSNRTLLEMPRQPVGAIMSQAKGATELCALYWTPSSPLLATSPVFFFVRPASYCPVSKSMISWGSSRRDSFPFSLTFGWPYGTRADLMRKASTRFHQGAGEAHKKRSSYLHVEQFALSFWHLTCNHVQDANGCPVHMNCGQDWKRYDKMICFDHFWRICSHQFGCHPNENMFIQMYPNVGHLLSSPSGVRKCQEAIDFGYQLVSARSNQL